MTCLPRPRRRRGEAGAPASDQPPAPRRHDRRARHLPARDRLGAGSRPRLLRRRRRARARGRPAPRAHARLGRPLLDERSPEPALPRGCLRRDQRALPELPRRPTASGSAVRARTTASGGRCSRSARRSPAHRTPGIVERAVVLFGRALPAAGRVTSPRAQASVVLGCAAVARSRRRRGFRRRAGRRRSARRRQAVMRQLATGLHAAVPRLRPARLAVGRSTR